MFTYDSHWDDLFYALLFISLVFYVFAVVQQLFFFSWEFSGDELYINKGIFIKEKLIIPKERVKEVQINLPWHFKIFKRYSINILSSTPELSHINLTAVKDDGIQVFKDWHK